MTTQQSPDGPPQRLWRRRWFLRVAKFIALVVGLLFIAWVWPDRPIRMAEVHPALRELQFPLRKVAVAFYLDGGSIGVRIEDANGRVLMYALPGETWRERYNELLLGAMHKRNGETRRVESPRETMRYLQRLVDESAPVNVDKVVALAEWRKSPRDYLRLIGWILLNRFDGVGIWRAQGE